MRAHSKSDLHLHACQASTIAESKGTIVQHLQHVEDDEKGKNRAAIKALIHCTHFLACQHIAHTTEFDRLVDLVLSCGGETLKTFLETTGKKIKYTSKITVFEFLEALGTWVEETLLKHLDQAPFYSIMADELRNYLFSANGQKTANLCNTSLNLFVWRVPMVKVFILQ